MRAVSFSPVDVERSQSLDLKKKKIRYEVPVDTPFRAGQSPEQKGGKHDSDCITAHVDRRLLTGGLPREGTIETQRSLRRGLSTPRLIADGS